MLLTCIMGMATFSVLRSIIVLYFYHHITNKRPPRCVRIIFFKIIARLLCMTANVPEENQVIPLLDETVQQSKSFGGKRDDGDDVIVHGEHENEYDVSGDVVKVRPPSVTKDGGGVGGGGADCAAHVAEIVQHLRMSSARVERKERSGMILDEWKAIAIVLDRVFFWLAMGAVAAIVPLFMLRQDSSH